MREESCSGGHGAAVLGDLDLTVGDQEVRTLVDLVLLQLLARGQADGDRARLVVGSQDLRVMGLDRQ
jgi:hypothetical protein